MILSVFINLDKKNATGVLDRLLEAGRKHGIVFQLLKKSVQNSRYRALGVSEQAFVSKCRYAVVIGGDGTFISASHYFIDKGVPLMGINIGQFGFLTEVEEDEIEENILKLLHNKIRIEERLVLEGKLVRDGRTQKTFRALNEVVISHGLLSKIIRVRAYVNNHYAGSFTGDGVMVSTPTGSTGYSLSAGGPIVTPAMDVFIFNTICPHTLTFRPLVISSHARVVLENVHPYPNVVMSHDGFEGTPLKKGDKVLIRKFARPLKLITSPDRNFFDILREKFKWVE